jgi:hypothetical protein
VFGSTVLRKIFGPKKGEAVGILGIPLMMEAASTSETPVNFY